MNVWAAEKGGGTGSRRLGGQCSPPTSFSLLGLLTASFALAASESYFWPVSALRACVALAGTVTEGEGAGSIRLGLVFPCLSS